VSLRPAATLCDRCQASLLGGVVPFQIRRSERWQFVALSLPAVINEAENQ